MSNQSRTIGIFYFSGTGNTKAVAELLAASFTDQGCAVERVAIEEFLKHNTTIEMEKYDIVGFGYPVHAFNAPHIFFDFLKKIPESNQKKTFVFKSSGDPFMNGGSTALVRKVLQQKGYHVFYEQLFVMPANVLIRLRDPLIKQLYLTAIRRGKISAQEILAERVRLQNNTWFLTALTLVFSAMESSGARYFGKHLTIADTCTECGICIQQCPTGNITKQDGKITFDSQCTLCMRCIYQCPVHAIFRHYMKFFVIKPWYQLQKIVNDPSIKDTYITKDTKGYFRHYYQYIIED